MADTIRLRYAGTCRSCGTALAKGTEARYDRSTKTVECASCPPDVEPALIDAGVAGGSARAIADRQRAKRERKQAAEEAAIREALPKLGGLVVGVRRFFAEPESPTSWEKGAVGEEAVGRRFAALSDEGFVVLHDRREPGKKWNIDHIVVGPNGVYVIDAKHYRGPLEIRRTGSLFRPGPHRVFVNGRPQDKRVAAMDWQVDAVRDAVDDLLEGTGASVRPFLCFLGVEVGLLQKPALVGPNDVVVTWPRQFVKDVSRTGPLTPEQVDEVARRIATRLPAAAKG